MNKGFEIQFHWIFIMIAGAIILTFFITVVTKYTAVAQDQNSVTLGRQLDTIFTGANAGKQTTQRIQLAAQPKTEPLLFTCTNTCQCAFATGSKTTLLHSTPVFSSEKLSGTEITYTTLDWNIPYRAGVFVYLTTNQDNYLFVYNPTDTQSTELLRRITSKLPSDLRTTNISITQDNTEHAALQKFFSSTSNTTFDSIQNTENTHIIFVNTQPTNTQLTQILAAQTESKQHNRALSSMAITSGGSIQYYAAENSFNTTNTNAITSSWTNDAELIGAVYSANQHQYTCNIRQAYARAQWITEIHTQRLEALQTTCTLNNLRELFSQLQQTTSSLSQTTGTPAETQDILKLKELQQQLDKENQQLTKANCPPVY